ncbi:MAG TPA: hypothetical protein EYP05_01370 [Piscirickettsiaceae bacterium]|nr:hypothetical protein [Piscirickettsiaceae bacterium]
MKRPYALIFLMTFLGLLAGWGAGAYLSNAGLKATIAAMPAAPVVVAAEYDNQTKTLALTFSNPGGQSINLLGKAIAFKPKEGKGYEMAFVHFEQPLVVPPFSVETLRVQLKADTADLVEGDVVATTIQYVYPLVPGVFDLTYVFTKGQPVKVEKQADQQTDKK